MNRFVFLLLSHWVCCWSGFTFGQEITVVDRQHILAEVIGSQVQFVDVRTHSEYQSGHIDNAVNYNVMDLEKFKKQIQGLDKEIPVYLYCKSGVRSKRASKLMKEEGFLRIYDYSGGYEDWERLKN